MSASCLASLLPGPLSTLHTRTPVACRQHTSDRVRKHEEHCPRFGRSVRSGYCWLGVARYRFAVARPSFLSKATRGADHSRTVLGPRRWGKRRTCARGRVSGPGTHSKPRSRSPRHRDSSRSAHETAVQTGLCVWRRSPACDSQHRKGPVKSELTPARATIACLFVRLPLYDPSKESSATGGDVSKLCTKSTPSAVSQLL